MLYFRKKDEERRKTEKRLEYNRKIDEERRKTEERLVYFRKKDEERRKTEERLEYNRKIDEERRKIEERLAYNTGIDEKRRLTSLLKSVGTDTGFNVICVCCTEYKSRSMCTEIQVLSQQQQDIFLPSNSKKCLSKDGKAYLCQPCRSKIIKGKKPKKSEKDRYESSNFPIFLKSHLKKVTNYLAVVKKKKKK